MLHKMDIVEFSQIVFGKLSIFQEAILRSTDTPAVGTGRRTEIGDDCGQTRSTRR